MNTFHFSHAALPLKRGFSHSHSHPHSHSHSHSQSTDPKVLFRAMVSDEAKRRRLSIEEYLSPVLTHSSFDSDDDDEDDDESLSNSEVEVGGESFKFRALRLPGPALNLTLYSCSVDPLQFNNNIYNNYNQVTRRFSTSTVPSASASLSLVATTKRSQRPRAESLDSSTTPPSATTTKPTHIQEYSTTKYHHPIQQVSPPLAPTTATPPVQVRREKLPPIPKEIDFSLYKDTSSAQPVSWAKGGPLTFSPDTPCLDSLSTQETLLCRTLRLFPAQYIQIKQAVIAGTYTRPVFKKKELRQWFPIDVNKVNKLYDW
ncbi:hypothetical protein HDU79_010586 [Rhizoclosmatium sp. JEL0117]|nr:hypothetical protein HDU79_010586 [Rhizoclosmatium sp. JEL0117]